MSNLIIPDFDAIPEFLRDNPYWCIWAAIPEANGRIGKRPLGAGGYPIGVDNPEKWISFDNAKAFYEANKGKTLHSLKGPISGIGSLLHDTRSIVGIDFDHVINSDGTIAQWAEPLVTELKAITYCEISPSGTGIHAFLCGKKPSGDCRGNDLEVYDNKRYLTVTGRRLEGCQNTVIGGPEAQAMIDKLVAYIRGNKKTISTGGRKATRKPLQKELKQLAPKDGPETLTDSELLDKIRQSRQGRKFSTLYDSGDITGYPSHSEADQALCNILASWTAKDAPRMDRLMRDSALLQEPERLVKWNKVHIQGATYGDATIATAIRDCKWCYEINDYRKKSQSKPTPKQINPDYFPLAEEDIAVRFVAKHKENIRYCRNSGKWYRWNGQIWEKETPEEALNLMRIVCKEAAKLAGTKERKGLLSLRLYKHALEIAQSDEAMKASSETWDTDIFLLGTPSGTVDLKTGKLRKASQTDYITKTTSIAPDKDNSPPLWTKFLDEATAGDKELQRFMQQIAGMVLTGDTTEHALFFVYGPGGNGKSVFLTAITEILQDYAVTAAMETFINSPGDRHPTELAMLHGARLVTASETEEGRNWAESKIKQLTGGDKISARYMRQDFFTFLPQFKLLIIGNHKPSIRTLDEAIKRRINIIPFTHTPQEKDTHLSEKLRAEYPSILRWMIEGCLDWQENGLQKPACVQEATENYFADQDLISQWIDECCKVDPIFKGKSSELFASWKEFAERNGIKPGNSKTFKSSMERRGYECKQVKTGSVYLGVCLELKEETKRYPD